MLETEKSKAKHKSMFEGQGNKDKIRHATPTEKGYIRCIVGVTTIKKVS